MNPIGSILDIIKKGKEILFGKKSEKEEVAKIERDQK